MSSEDIITRKFSVRLCKIYCSNYSSRHFQIQDKSGNFPDGVVFNCATGENRTITPSHTIEAKSINTKSDCVSSGNALPAAYKQAKKYYGNFNWLILTRNLWRNLSTQERISLINICENYPKPHSRAVGLAIVATINTKGIKPILLKVLPKRISGSFLSSYPNIVIKCSRC